MFKVRRVEIEGKYNYTVMLLEDDAAKIGLKAGDRIRVCKSDCNMSKNDFLVCDLLLLDPNLPKEKRDIKLQKGEIGVFENALQKLDLFENQRINVMPAAAAHSMQYINQKFKGEIKLNEKQFEEIIKDIILNRYTDVELTMFILACAAHQLDDLETIGLTKAMINAGKHLDFRNKKNHGIVVDKHCIGGVPGNRTTMLVIPIAAAAGLTIPKTSSRSITSPAGTADTMEVLANVDIELQDMDRIVKEVGGCLAWGGALDLSPADDIIIQVEHPLKIDSEGQMIASILSKKVSAGATHVLLDIPVGEGAKYKDKKEGERLKKRFEVVGKAVGLKMKVIISDGSHPIGRGIGPLLEALDVIKVLKNDLDQPLGLRDKAIEMAGTILEMGGKAKKGHGKRFARDLLEDGRAFEKFNQIIEAQGKKKPMKVAKISHDIKAKRSGKVKHVHNKKIAKIAFMLGDPNDKSAGIYLHKKTGERVLKGDVVCTLYTSSNTKMKYAKLLFEEDNPYRIG